MTEKVIVVRRPIFPDILETLRGHGRVFDNQSGTSLEILLSAFSTGSLRTKKVIRVREVENT
jgi:hypothetical protein